MLISETIRLTHFTETEQSVIHFVEKNKENIKDLTLREAAKACFTYPSTFIRVAKKLGFSGWNSFKEEYLKELMYLNSSFTTIDANRPFEPNDSIMSIASKLSNLATETITDTMNLLNHDTLAKSISIIENASETVLFTKNHNLLLAKSFCIRMNRIGIPAHSSDLDGELLFDASNVLTNACAIVISYSGESSKLIEAISILKKRNIPIILLTSIGSNSMTGYADVILRITTREKLYSKIASFSVLSSIDHLLNILYSCIFAKNYTKNYNHLLGTSLLADGRTSKSELIGE